MNQKRTQAKIIFISLLMSAIAVLIFAHVAVNSARARDDGRYAQSPLKQWFNSLQNKNGAGCCDTADGRRLADAEWWIEKEQYWVKIDGVAYAVPPEALLTQPNRAGMAIVWPMQDQTGATIIRCFIPGSLT